MTLQTNGSTTAISGSQSFASESQCQRTATIFPLEQSPAQSARVEFYEAVRRASELRLPDRVRGLRLRGGRVRRRGRKRGFPVCSSPARFIIAHRHLAFAFSFFLGFLLSASKRYHGREPTARSPRSPVLLSRSRLLSSFKGPRQPKEHTASPTDPSIFCRDTLSRFAIVE